MCGIVGQISFNNKINENFLIDSLKIISHRGMDKSNYQIFKNVGLGHNLLSITGNLTVQPIYNFNKTIFAVVNGEFYNYENIKKELGLEFKTKSDSELIIHLYSLGLLFKYLENGKINGEFSFILYDSNINKVYIGRDSFGIKPIYLYQNEDQIYLSSEIKSFLSLNRLSFDQKSLYSVFTMQYHDTYNTIFKDVKQIQPGTVLIIDIKEKKFEEYKYFEIKYEENYIDDFEETKNKLYIEMDKAIKIRTLSDKKVGITLSGGIDSASILALSSKYLKNKDCYTISFENSGIFDEYSYAKEMADMYSFNFNPIFVNSEILLDNFEKAIFHSEQFCINLHVSSKYLLFKKMYEDGVKVSLSGEGSDEIFFGYPHFRLDNNVNVYNKNSYLSGLQIPDKDILNTDKVLNLLGYVPSFIKAKYSIGYKIHEQILKEDFKNKFKDIDPASEIIEFYNLDKKVNKVFNSSILWSKICMSNYILNALGDKLEMAHTIEGRVPFLDRNLFNYVSKIPLDYKIKGDIEKHILKETVKPIISKSIYDKQKHPFISPPILNWDNNNIVFEHIMDILNSKSIIENEIIDYKTIINIIKNIKDDSNKKSTYDPVLMIILSFYYLNKNFC